MKNPLFQSILCLVFLSFVVSCSKKSEPKEVVISKETLAGSYMLTAATAGGFDVYNSYLEPCQRDDVYKLNTDFTAIYVDGGTKCSPPGDAAGTWNLVGTTKIVIIGQEADIVSYDGKTLVVSGRNSSSPLPVKLTFTKQ